MTGDHHGRTATRATLLVTAADEILGTHNRDEGISGGSIGLDTRAVLLDANSRSPDYLSWRA
ncbi:MAG: hypothetical protein WBW33_10930 [Bryobacteraceae bacterium]